MDQPSLEHRQLQAETYLAIERILRSEAANGGPFQAEKLSDITPQQASAPASVPRKAVTGQEIARNSPSHRSP